MFFFSAAFQTMNVPEHSRCPGCSGNMIFDIGKQGLVCESCGLVLSVPEYDAAVLKKARGNVSLTGAADRILREHEGQADMNRIYACRSCGGLVRPGARRASGVCPFCGNAIVFTDKITEQEEPDYIIPFRKDREYFEKICRKYVAEGFFVPENFRKEARVAGIQAVYIPFWLYNLELCDRISCDIEEVHPDKDKFVHYCYRAEVSGSTAFRGVPQDASLEIPDEITQTLEPYPVSEAVPFNFGYLSGLDVRICDVDSVCGFEAVKDRILASSARALIGMKYDNIRIRERDFRITRQELGYAIYPVWTMTLVWEGGNYTFAMNGATGKCAGVPPTDKGLVNTAGYLGGLLLFLPAIMFMTGMAAVDERMDHTSFNFLFANLAGVLLLTALNAGIFWKKYIRFAGHPRNLALLKGAAAFSVLLLFLDTGMICFRGEYPWLILPWLLFLISLGLGGIIRDFFLKYIRKETASLSLNLKTDAAAYGDSAAMHADSSKIEPDGRYWSREPGMQNPRPKFGWI